MSVDADLEIHNCPACFVRYALPVAMVAARRADGKSFYCPNGHSLSFKDSDVDKLRRERDRLKQLTAQKDDEIAAAKRREQYQRDARERAERHASAMKGVATRLRNRAAAGECPCCNKRYVHLANHMQTKHPDFQHQDIEK